MNESKKKQLKETTINKLPEMKVKEQEPMMKQVIKFKILITIN